MKQKTSKCELLAHAICAKLFVLRLFDNSEKDDYIKIALIIAKV